MTTPYPHQREANALIGSVCRRVRRKERAREVMKIAGHAGLIILLWLLGCLLWIGPGLLAGWLYWGQP